MINKTFRLDRTINVPKDITSKNFPEGDLHIAKENPAWILTNSIESIILQLLRDDKTVREAVMYVYNTGQFETRVLEDNTKSLLEKIELWGFYEGATVHDDGKFGLHLYLTNYCNLRCRHCYKDAGKKKGQELTTEEIKTVIDGFSKQGNSQIVLSGGEVLTRPDFFEIATYIKSKGHRVIMVTNGILIRDREMALKLTEIVDFLQISLDGATDKVNDYYRGKGTYDQIINAINLFQGTDFEISIGMVVSEYNYEDIRANLEFLLREKIKHDRIKINVSGLMDYGRGKFCKTSGNEFEFVERFFEDASKLGIKQKQWRLPNTKAFDCGYARSITIDSDGTAYYCPVANDSLKTSFNVRSNTMQEIMDHFKTKNSEVSVEYMGSCGECELEYLCGGGCRLENLIQRGSLLRPECTAEKKEMIYKELIKLRI